jgi:hypothetical protein
MEESSALKEHSPKPPRLLEQLRDVIRRRHYSMRTEETYVHWVKRFIYFPVSGIRRSLAPRRSLGS